MNRRKLILFSKRGTSTPVNLMEFDASLTTPSAGSLTNVYGSPWTVVRNTISTYIDSDTLMKDAAINVPVIDHELGYPRIISYPESSNHSPWSEKIDRITTPSNVTLSAVTDPRGNSLAVRIANASGLSGNATRFNLFHSTNGVSYTGSFWARKNSVGALSTNDVAMNYYNGIDAGWLYFGDQLTSEWKRFDVQFNATVTGTTTGVFKFVLAVDCEVDIFGTNATDTASLTQYIAELDGTVPDTRGGDSITNTVPPGASRLVEWIDEVEQIAIPAHPGVTFTMKNGTTKLIIDDQIPVKPSTEVYPDGNAASIWNEADSIGAWTNVPSPATVISQSVETDASDFALEVEATGSFGYATTPITVVSGNSYRFTIRAKRNEGFNDEQQFYGWTGVVTSPAQLINLAGWNTWVFDVVANSTTIVLKVNATRATSTPGAKVWIDNVSVLDLGVI